MWASISAVPGFRADSRLDFFVFYFEVQVGLHSLLQRAKDEMDDESLCSDFGLARVIRCNV